MERAKRALIIEEMAGMTSALQQTAQCETTSLSLVYYAHKNIVTDLYNQERESFRCTTPQQTVKEKNKTLPSVSVLHMCSSTCFSKMREISPRVRSRPDTLLLAHWPLSWPCSCFNRSFTNRCNLNTKPKKVTNVLKCQSFI